MPFVNLYSITEDGRYVIPGRKRKECPNCFVMFIKDENGHYIRKSNRNIYFCKCPLCGCRIKVFRETTVNYYKN